jgi:uncharacterized protein YqeY
VIDRIDKDVKAAMKSGDATRRDALRLVLSSLRDAEKAAQRPLTDAEGQAVLRRELKRRREAAKAFEDAGHADRAAAEESEAALIEGYLPAQLPDEDLDTSCRSRWSRSPSRDMATWGRSCARPWHSQPAEPTASACRSACAPASPSDRSEGVSATPGVP